MILFVSLCCKPLKKDPSGYVLVPHEKYNFYQMHTLITDLCLLQLNLKMSITISKGIALGNKKDYIYMVENLKMMLLSIKSS